MSRTCTLSPLLLLALFLQATARQDTISLHGNWLIGHTYSYCNSEPSRIPGLLARDALFTSLMRSNPRSHDLYRQSIAQSRIGAGCVGVGVVAALAIVLAGQKQERGLRPGLLLIAAVPVTAGLTMDYLGSRKMKMAVSAYNTGRTPGGR